MFRKISVAATVLLMITASAFAQTDPQRPGQPRPGNQPQGNQQPSNPQGTQQGTRQGNQSTTAQATPGQAGHHAGSIDQHVATCLMISNANEIAMAEFAQSRVQNERVKQFINTLIADHEKGLQKAQEMAPQHADAINQMRRQSQTNPNNRDSAGRNDATGRNNIAGRTDNVQPGNAGLDRENRTPGQPQTGQGGIDPATGRPTGSLASDRRVQDQTLTSDRAGLGMPNPELMFQIEKQAAEICRQMMTEELSRKSGTEFDKAFVGSQVGAHIHGIAKLQAVQPHVTEKMRPMVDEALSMMQHHLEEARNICEMLDQEHSRNGQNNPSR